LHDLQQVHVTGAGFPAGKHFDISQCHIANGKNSGVCYGATLTSVDADGSGAFDTTFFVRRVIVEGISTVDCAVETCGITTGSPFAAATLTFTDEAPNRPALTATPNTALAAGTVVSVRGTGFTPDAAVTVAQCAGNGVGLVGCDTTNRAAARTDAGGTFSAQLTVGDHVSALGAPQVDCTGTDPTACSIVGANTQGASEFARAVLSFGTTPATTPGLPRTGGSTEVPLVGATACLVFGISLLFGARRRGVRVRR
jgi:hypothetical protein